MSYIPWIKPGRDPMTRVDFVKMSAKAAEAFTRRWIDTIPERVVALETYVRSTRGFKDWRAEYSHESLVRLGSWALEVLRFIPPDSAKVEREIAQSKGLSRSDKTSLREALQSIWTYEDEALGRSVAFDIFMYFGECLRRKCPALFWCRDKDDKVNTYNSPCLFAPNGNPWFTPVFDGAGCLQPILKRNEPPDLIAIKFDAILKELQIHKYIGNHPPPVLVINRKGKTVTTRCPKCGFGFARVIVNEGIYCNHCGNLQTVDDSAP